MGNRNVLRDIPIFTHILYKLTIYNKETRNARLFLYSTKKLIIGSVVLY